MNALGTTPPPWATTTCTRMARSPAAACGSRSSRCSRQRRRGHGADLPKPQPYACAPHEERRLDCRDRSLGRELPAPAGAARDPRKTFASYAHLRREHDVSWCSRTWACGRRSSWRGLPRDRRRHRRALAHAAAHRHARRHRAGRPDRAATAIANARRPMQLGEIVLVLQDGKVVEKCAFVYAIDRHRARSPSPRRHEPPTRRRHLPRWARSSPSTFSRHRGQLPIPHYFRIRRSELCTVPHSAFRIPH
jgi:hypothetical protein